MTEMPYSVEVAGEGEVVEVGALADEDVGDLGEGHLLEEDALVLVEPALQPVDLRDVSVVATSARCVMRSTSWRAGSPPSPVGRERDELGRLRAEREDTGVCLF